MRTALWLSVVAGLTAAQAYSQATIETGKVRTLVDRNGRGFTRAPMMIAAFGDGRYALQEINQLPMVVDSTGRLIRFFARGEGPGEFAFNATAMSVGPGDTLYAGNQQLFNVYGPDLKFVRAFPVSSGHAGHLIPIRGGFILSAQRPEPPYMTSVHVIGLTGDRVRSFVRDTFDTRAWPRPSYRIGLASGGNGVWIADVYSHRIEKWSLDGRRLVKIAARPTWFDNTRPIADGRPYVRGIEESNGILWIMSAVPVPNYRAIMAAAMRGRGNDVDARFVPDEKLWTTRIEAYDAATGTLIADQAIKAYGIGLLSGREFATYRPGPNDEAQIDIWQMTVRRGMKEKSP